MTYSCEEEYKQAISDEAEALANMADEDALRETVEALAASFAYAENEYISKMVVLMKEQAKVIKEARLQGIKVENLRRRLEAEYSSSIKSKN